MGVVSNAVAAVAQAASQMAEAGTGNNDTVVDVPLAAESAGISDDNEAVISAIPPKNATVVADDVDSNLNSTLNGKEDDNATLAEDATSSSYTTAAVQGLPASVAEGSNQDDKGEKDDKDDDKNGKNDKKKGSKKKNADDTGGGDSNNNNVDRPPEQVQEAIEDMILEEDSSPYIVSRDRDTSLCAYEVAGILTCIQWDSFCTGECDFNSYQNGSGCHVTQRMPSNSDDDVEPAGCGCDETKMCKCHHPLHDIEYHIGRECLRRRVDTSGGEQIIFPGILNVDDEESANQSSGNGWRKLARMVNEENKEQRTARTRHKSSNLRRRRSH